MTYTPENILPADVWTNEAARAVPCLDSLRWYIERGAPVGHFLHALLANNLVECVHHADGTNKRAIPEIVTWLFNYAPRECWGSEDKVNAWQLQNGLVGVCARVNSEAAAKEGAADGN